MVEVSFIIVSFNTCHLLRECIHAIQNNADQILYEIIVVDNDSKDGSPDMVAHEFPSVHLIRSPINLGFGKANNLAAKHARGRYLIMINSDAFLGKDSLQQAIRKMDKNPHVGLAGGKLLDKNGQVQPSARKFPSIFQQIRLLCGFQNQHENSDQAAPTDWITGAFFITRKDLFQKVGGFDENFFLYSEEVDLCKKIKAAGYAIWYWPEIVNVHLGGESAKTFTTVSLSENGCQLTLWRMRSEFLYFRKHHGWLSAFFIFRLEYIYFLLRSLKNALTLDKMESQQFYQQAQLLKQAWQETQGGSVSPPRPW